MLESLRIIVEQFIKSFPLWIMFFASCLIILSLSYVQENILLYFCLKALLICLSHLDWRICVYGVREHSVFFISACIFSWPHAIYQEEFLLHKPASSWLCILFIPWLQFLLFASVKCATLSLSCSRWNWKTPPGKSWLEVSPLGVSFSILIWISNSPLCSSSSDALKLMFSLYLAFKLTLAGVLFQMT